MSQGKYLEFRRHQQFLADYMQFKGPFRTILLYHGLGSKTCSAINIINSLFQSTDKWNIYLLIKLHYEMIHGKRFTKMFKSKHQRKTIIFINFIHYNAPNASEQFEEKLRETQN